MNQSDKSDFLKKKTNKEMLIALFFRMSLLEKMLSANTALLASIVHHLKIDYQDLALENLLRKDALYRGLADEIESQQLLIDALLLLNYSDESE